MNEPQSVYQALATYRAPRWEDFPKVDLYMDQVLELLNEWLRPLSFDTDKKPVTASMINNYVKNSIVLPPVKKKYTTYHLAYLYVVMVLKQCFSLQEISSLIMIYTDMETSAQTRSNFNSFASAFEFILHQIMETGRLDSGFFEQPTWQQLLMVDVLEAISCRLYAACTILRFDEQKKKEKSRSRK